MNFHRLSWLRRGCTLLGAGLILSTLPLVAQSNYSDKAATRQMSAGLYGLVGVSHTFQGVEGNKDFGLEDEVTIPTLAWRAGATVGYPLTPVVRASLSLGIDNRGFTSKTTVSLAGQKMTSEGTSHIQYFSIMPGMQFSAFFLGLNIGLPTGGTHTAGDASIDFTDNETEQLSTMIEPRIGAVIPLVDEKVGWLGMLIEAGYSLNGVGKEQTSNNVTVTDPHQLMTFQLGLTWQFAIPGAAN